MSSLRATTKAALALAACLVAATPAPAEVGVVGHAPGAQTLYIFGAIGDDPEPIGITWDRHTTVSPDRVVLNESGRANGDGPPSATQAPDGTPLVAWARNSAEGFDVVISAFDGVDWATPLAVADGPEDEVDPAVFADAADGSIHVVYWILDGSPRVMHRQAPADLSTWSAPEQVSAPGEIAVRPSGVFHNGVLRVVYEAHDSGLGTVPRRIVMATLSQGGWFWTTIAETAHAGDNVPQVHSAGGRLWIDWIDATGQLAWIRQPAPGLWDPIDLEPFTDPGDRNYHVRGRVRRLAIAP